MYEKYFFFISIVDISLAIIQNLLVGHQLADQKCHMKSIFFLDKKGGWPYDFLQPPNQLTVLIYDAPFTVLDPITT